MFTIPLPDVATGATITGATSASDVENLQKALTAGYGTDVSQFSGGAALRIQSLDKTMKSTIQETKHFRLFNELAKSGATATVDEWTERSDVGGFLGGSTNTETGTIAVAQGTYNRRVGLVKYLMTQAQVSLVATLGNNIASAEAVEAQSACLRLLTDAEFLCFEGDSTIVPTEFDGIYAQMLAGVNAGQVDTDNIIDAGGASLSSIDSLNQAAAVVSRYGNFGEPTHIFYSQKVQADFDTALDPAFRVPLPDVHGGGTTLGSPVVGIRTSHGNIKTVADVFVREDQRLSPFQVIYAALATANASLQPTVATDASVTDAASNFSATTAGNYYWLVTGLNASGESTGVVSGQVAVAAGKKVTLTITASGGGQETGYGIYRSRLNGTNTPSDMRLMARVAKAGATTTYVDYNRDIPGTTRAYVLNMASGADAISWRQLLPMMKFQLYPTNSAVIPWAQLLFGYLRMTKRKQHAIIKNILPASAAWRPFNV